MDRYEGEIQLRSGHSVILGNIPIGGPVTVKDLAEKIILDNTDMEKFGFWETASPNYATYYPEATPEQFIPKDEEFIYPVFRMLSEVIVSKGRPIDFSKAGVLKRSMNKLIGQTINIDHETALGNAIGSVSEVYWQKGYIAKDGTKVPAGINAVLKIDAKSNPRIARGINMEPPSIHSNSVTVRFSWVPSHKFDDINQFFYNLGTYHKDGELIRCVVDEIICYTETSLVGHGADVFAQKVDENGEIVNPTYASDTYQFSADKPITTIFNTDYKNLQNSDTSDIAILSLSNSDKPLYKKNQHNPNSMEELLTELIESFGFDSNLKEENLNNAIKEKLTSLNNKITEKETEIGTLGTKIETLTTENVNLKEENENLSANKEEITKLTNNTRNEALRYAKLVLGENPDEAITNLIANADLTTAAALLKQYRSQSESKFSATCNKCGSNEVTRLSAIPSRDGIIDENTDGKNTGGNTVKTFSESRSNLKDKHKPKSRLFNKD